MYVSKPQKRDNLERLPVKVDLSCKTIRPNIKKM